MLSTLLWFCVLQAYCTGHSGKSEPSLGRKRRETQDNEKSTVQEFPKSVLPPLNESESTNEEHVREMIEVNLTYGPKKNEFTN